MDAAAKEALKTIRLCVQKDRVRLLSHFRERMAQRGLVWADVLTVLAIPTRLRADGVDDWNRERWVVSGCVTTGMELDILCVLSHDDEGMVTVFITLFWK